MQLVLVRFFLVPALLVQLRDGLVLLAHLVLKRANLVLFGELLGFTLAQGQIDILTTRSIID